MKVKDYICKSGKSPELNEDYLIFQEHHFALLLDGSTGLGTAQVSPGGGYHTMAQWFVHRMGELVREKIGQTEDLRQMLRECITVLKSEYEEMVPCDDSLSPKERRLQEPSASLALLRETDRQVELFMLGDLSVLLKYADGQVEQLHDDSVGRLDAEVIQLIVDIREKQHISVREAMKTEAVQEKLKENRLKKNSGDAEGYWILGLDKESLDYGKLYCWNKDDGKMPISMIICSDGFSAYYDKYECSGLLSGERESLFYQRVESRGLKELYGELRNVENSDKDCNKYPRFKQSDDAAAIWIGLKRRKPHVV